MATATLTDPFDVMIPEPSQRTELLKTGDYIGALVKLIDLGTHATEYQGEDTGRRRQVYLVWELNATQADGSKHLVALQFTNSYDKKAKLKKMIEKCLRVELEPGQASPIRSMLGQSFAITIAHKKSGDRVFHRIADDGVGPLHRLETPIPADEQRAHFVYSIKQGRPNRADFADVPYLYGRPVCDVICECDELHGSGAATESAPDAAEMVQPAARSSVARDEILGRIEGHLAKAAMLGSPAGGPEYSKAVALMKEHVVGDTELSQEAQARLDTPF